MGVRGEGIGVRAGGKSSEFFWAGMGGSLGTPPSRPNKKLIWGRDGGVPGRRRQSRELGGRSWGRGDRGKGVGKGSSDFEFFWGREGRVPGRWRQRPGMDWPSGLGGVGGRGRASTHRAFS